MRRLWAKLTKNEEISVKFSGRERISSLQVYDIGIGGPGWGIPTFWGNI